MILEDLSEKALYDAFYQILEYSRSKELSWWGRESWEEDRNRKFKLLMEEELRLHFEEILQDFDSKLTDIYTKEICIKIGEDGKAILQREQILDIYQLKGVFLDLYNRYQNYESFPILRRLLLSRSCLEQLINQQPNIKVSKELIGEEVSRYILLCYIDHKFLPLHEDIISSPFLKCFNQIKKNIEGLKQSNKKELFDRMIDAAIKAINNNNVKTFKKRFSEKLIRENYSMSKQQYDLIAELCFKLLQNTSDKMKERGEALWFGSISKDLLFEWLLRRSLIYEIYVYRKLIDAGIPCMFRVELENKQGEFDLVYCTNSMTNVVEVKSGSLNMDISEKIKLLKENGIGKYVIICPDKVASKFRSDSKYDQVDILSFTELSDVNKLSKLIANI